ncbi:unnamed protein product [Caenorhabditis angaria]|uniref:Uncharacterized protein n=1 Tax=Caenorhabditis angaria TaxID=860376 RepID=A0A9P1J0H1_9PELO|nr:unnamed protein product [Caenorhabditis angaria]
MLPMFQHLAKMANPGPDPAILLAKATEKLRIVKEEERRIIDIICQSPEIKMTSDDFRFILFKDGKPMFDSKYFKPDNAPNENNIPNEPPNYDLFNAAHLPTICAPIIDEIEINVVGQEYMASVGFPRKARGEPRPLCYADKPIRSFRDLQKTTITTDKTKTYWRAKYPGDIIPWSWHFEKPQTGKNLLSFRDCRILKFRRFQMEQIRLHQFIEKREYYFEEKPDIQFCMAILVPIKHREFILNHTIYLERELQRMRNWVKNFVVNSRDYKVMLHNRWREMTDAFLNIHNSPKLKQPFWASMTRPTEHDNPQTLEQCFRITGHCFFDIIKRLEGNQQFVSKLLTAFLSHNLSWINTIPHIPREQEGGNTNIRWNLELVRKFLQEEIPFRPHSLELLNYLEMIGNCGPFDTVKVVITGSNEKDIAQICQMMTYFARFTFEKDGEPSIEEGESGISSDEDHLLEAYLERLNNERERIPNAIRRVEQNYVSKFPRFHEKMQTMRDLVSGPITKFSDYFAVQGIVKTPDNNTFDRMIRELRKKDENVAYLPYINEKISKLNYPQNIYIYADIDDRSVRIVSDKTVDQILQPSKSIVDFLQRVKQQDFNGSDILVEMDDLLRDMVQKSETLVETLRVESTAQFIEIERICTIVDCDESDVRLLINLASTYFPLTLMTPRDPKLSSWC